MAFDVYTFAFGTLAVLFFLAIPITLASLYFRNSWLYVVSIIATAGANYLGYIALAIGPMGMSTGALEQYNTNVLIDITAWIIWLTIPFILIALYAFFFRKQLISAGWFTSLRLLILIPSLFGIIDLFT